MLLGVHMIARNEADVLRRCLLSVKSFADEIVVADTGSTDDTAEIAKQCGARVLSVEWQDDFAKARNELLKHARTVWVLVLDADEWAIANEKSGKMLREELKRTTEAALRLPMQHELTAGDAVVPKLTSDAVRLFRADYGFVYYGEIHEQLVRIGTGASEGRMYDVDGPLSTSGIVIGHDGYVPDTMTRKSKAKRNLRIIKGQLARRPNDPFCLYNLGVTQCQLGQAEAASRTFLQSLDAVEHDAPYRPTLVRDYAKTLITLNRMEAAEELLQKETGIYSDYTDLYWLHGVALQALQLLPEAKAAYETAIELEKGIHKSGAVPVSYISEAGASSYRAKCGLGDVLVKLGQSEKALHMYEEALDDRPDWQPALNGLAYAMLLRGAGDTHIRDQLAVYTGEESDNGLRQLARAMCEIGAYRIAMPIWREQSIQGRKGKGLSTDTRLIADALIGTGQYAEAAKLLMMHVQLLGGDEAAALDAALCWWNEGLPLPPITLARIVQAAGTQCTLARFKQIEVVMLGAPIRDEFWQSWLSGSKDSVCEAQLVRRAVTHGMLRLAARLTAAMEKLDIMFEQALYDEGYNEAAAELMLRRFAVKGELARGHWLRLGELLYNNYLFSEALAMFEGGIAAKEEQTPAVTAHAAGSKVETKLRMGAASSSLQLALAAVRLSGDPLVSSRGWDGSRYEDDGARLTDAIARLEALGWRTTWNGRQRRRANGEAPEAHFLMYDR
ncbi:glycosyltransferase [Paenibacillus sp. MCAF20]